MIEQLETRGFTCIEQRLDVSLLRDAVADVDTNAGVRNLAARIPAVHALAGSAPVRRSIEAILGRDAQLVRSILFNKAPALNWHVAWHQDVTIAVRSRVEMPGFGAWSVKEGVTHVQAPAATLEQMLTLRLHLDAADQDNGALWVAPGSHRSGVIRSQERAILQQCGTYLCAAQPGEALLMRPLLLHASRKSTSDRPRRVVHLEFAAAGTLPPPLAWAESGGA